MIYHFIADKRRHSGLFILIIMSWIYTRSQGKEEIFTWLNITMISWWHLLPYGLSKNSRWLSLRPNKKHAQAPALFMSLSKLKTQHDITYHPHEKPVCLEFQIYHFALKMAHNTKRTLRHAWNLVSTPSSDMTIISGNQ